MQTTEADSRTPRAARVAIIIPCYNEALAIGHTLDEIHAVLPHADLWVFDNDSSDDTAGVARAHGAQVVKVALRGKGNVVRRMFADVQADVYVMVDGDATYDPSGMVQHVRQLHEERLDMLVGCRVDDHLDAHTYRPGHRWGNRLLTGSVARIFGGHFSDMLSGYRVFSRRYVKSFPAISHGFEIETELTVHALELRMPYAEAAVAYRARPEGSASKLSTYRDGWRILKTIMKLYVVERPLAFFSLVAAIMALAAIGISIPLAITYAQTGLVPRLPTAVLATGLMIGAMLSLVCGAILNTVTTGRRETKRLFYLAIPVGPAT
ncbi:glycosyltransferase family 2 protein [Pseudorhodoferax sp. Leaf274]|uniref:glycosyltransferase family 2 protein n=1 Tax=Pseudorhodoferax sp. Leaf274 TaxID=1736318 RepID=UPI000703A526|nr:glycosyltransferase family 2 protein [Pseudorhodoferax sp. Leaf274]KQP41594.1 glycosyl transferase [Pseudorhodoferax sp. Leaf274]